MGIIFAGFIFSDKIAILTFELAIFRNDESNIFCSALFPGIGLIYFNLIIFAHQLIQTKSHH